MEKIDLKAIRKQLNYEREELVTRLAKEEERLRASAGSNPDWGDLAQQHAAKMRRMALVAQWRKQLQQIETSLHRMDENLYGICIECGKPIEPGRLKALPAVLLDKDCQERKERER